VCFSMMRHQHLILFRPPTHDFLLKATIRVTQNRSYRVFFLLRSYIYFSEALCVATCGLRHLVETDFGLEGGRKI
jgi:hypothetical protein